MSWETLLSREIHGPIQDQYLPGAMLRYFVLAADSLDPPLFTTLYASAATIYRTDRKARHDFDAWVRIHHLR